MWTSVSPCSEVRVDIVYLTPPSGQDGLGQGGQGGQGWQGWPGAPVDDAMEIAQQCKGAPVVEWCRLTLSNPR
jgi:hypothetical protein